MSAGAEELRAGVGNPDEAARAPSARARRIWLCADDYGLSPGVNEAIRALIERGRINATSVMVVAPSFSRAEAARLSEVAAHRKAVAVGLHLTMTAPFRPLTAFTPVAKNGVFLPIQDMLARAFWPRFDLAVIGREVTAQIDAFTDAFGRPPDYLDGHHHVHLMPTISTAVLAAVKSTNPDAWVRQCGQATPFYRRLHDRKGLLIDLLSRRLRSQARKLGVSTNPAFAGTYRFHPGASFAAFFPRFLDGMPDGGLIMCHPGFVDAELERLDPLTTLREQEFSFLSSDGFPALLAGRGFALA